MGRCLTDTEGINMFSQENNMDPGKIHEWLLYFTIIEQQLISRIYPCLNVHMINHRGIASPGHCVTFSQTK